MQKILNHFGCVKFRILVENWNIHEANFFPISLVDTCWLETFFLNARLSVDKKSPNSHYFYRNLGNCLTFMCSSPNDKYNLSYSKTWHSRTRQLRTWFLCFSCCSFLAFWGAENHVFYVAPFRSTSYVLKSFGCLEISNRGSKEIKPKNSCGCYFKLSNWNYRYSYTYKRVRVHYESQFHMRSLNFIV